MEAKFGWQAADHHWRQKVERLPLLDAQDWVASVRGKGWWRMVGGGRGQVGISKFVLLDHGSMGHVHVRLVQRIQTLPSTLENMTLIRWAWPTIRLPYGPCRLLFWGRNTQQPMTKKNSLEATPVPEQPRFKRGGLRSGWGGAPAVTFRHAGEAFTTIGHFTFFFLR